MTTWRPVTHVEEPRAEALAFDLSAEDRDAAASARHHIQQNLRRLNERDNHRTQNDARSE